MNISRITKHNFTTLSGYSKYELNCSQEFLLRPVISLLLPKGNLGLALSHFLSYRMDQHTVCWREIKKELELSSMATTYIF